jgi:cytochrome c peroxidase
MSEGAKGVESFHTQASKKDATWPSARVIATDNFRRVSESYYGIVSSRSLLAVAVVLGGLNQSFDLCLGQVLPCLQVLVGRGARASRNCAVASSSEAEGSEKMEPISGLIPPRLRQMNARLAAAVVTIVAMLSGAAVLAQQPSATLSPAALKEIVEVEAEIDRIETQTLERLIAPPDNEVQQVELLGKAMLYDKNLSVNRNEACAFCHMPETGFTGPVSELNRTTGSYPGSVRTRFSNRKPQSHAYAPLSPVLHYNPGQGDLVGGNFWDMRATGRRLGNPAAEQAEGPPTNPVEMGLPDIACAVYRASARPYRALFERIWGVQAFAIQWPSDVETVCNKPGPPPANDPTPVHLTELDRGRAAATFDQMAHSIAGYEASAEVTPFTSKFDAVLAGKAQFTPQEQAGYALFRGKAQCNNCHRDGGPGEDPLFTDFTASNIGTPANPMLSQASPKLIPKEWPPPGFGIA